MDDYFSPRLVAVDLLGNFIKEVQRDGCRRDRRGQRVAGIPRPGADRTRRGRRVLQAGCCDARAVPAGAATRPCGAQTVASGYDFILPGRVSR